MSVNWTETKYDDYDIVDEDTKDDDDLQTSRTPMSSNTLRTI